MRKKVLVTAGSTVVPIDKVRAITNIFKGKTGTAIAQYFDAQGYDVTLLTSSPEKVKGDTEIRVIKYKTYDELLQAMEVEIKSGVYDVIIHSSAVSDYKVDGIYIEDDAGEMVSIDKGGKVSSSYPEVYFKLTQTEKIIDKIKAEWGFNGYLVKFKLEVGKTDSELLQIAHKSKKASKADMIVANCLEWASERAYVISGSRVAPVSREEIAKEIEVGYEHHLRYNG